MGIGLIAGALASATRILAFSRSLILFGSFLAKRIRFFRSHERRNQIDLLRKILVFSQNKKGIIAASFSVTGNCCIYGLLISDLESPAFLHGEEVGGDRWLDWFLRILQDQVTET
jgi:hypothetical protein